jgi:GNAT superfamily N-acetyltransferase
MDGDTWGNYRFVTEAGEEPPFFLEPTNPPEWPEQFSASGFEPIAHYYSALTTRLGFRDPRASEAERRLTSCGVRVRPFDLDRFEVELRQIYPVAVTSFRHGFLYQPLTELEFMARYQQLKSVMRPGLSLVAAHGDRCVGFLFMVPDLLRSRLGQPLDTAIIKTFAVLPERQYAGLGSWLAMCAHRTAHDLGYKRVIHALMHESNHSRNISSRYGRPFRRYTLFSKVL